ncbi:MAG: anti-sigma factor [Candidatus Peribacteraceae bacterium]|nr:anti-sigma factor [Candidatus Peribacteraceae bacterium]
MILRHRTLAILVLPLLLSACWWQAEDDQGIGTETYNVILPQDGKAVHPKYGKETWFAYGAMNGVGEAVANGVAQAYLFEGGAYNLSLQLNMQIAKDGTFYEGWLKTESGQMLSLGHLSNHFGDVRHQLQFESTEDFSGDLQVVVTLEKDDGNPLPSKEIIAEGVLKPTKR